MAMSGSGLAAAIKSVVSAIPEEDRNFDAVWDAIGEAIVEYIKVRAEITVSGTANGVTAGMASVPVTGTGTLS